MTRQDAPTVAQLVEETVEPTERLETVLHRECRGPLGDHTEEWHEYTTAAALPDRALDGWEELLVFTDRHVYRWVEGGYDSGPTRVPRDPALFKTALC